ncbi:hypothetical protein predicted by Glimmer/Critica [Acetobacter senegalensis]|uniref:Uncharacterized protein n=1 Tax=Acetobacter senegalensis TaxID=446692 RepID=A0A0U5ETU3_9PROT|nr:hypothetical protein predicted by Glimmer/Critica [Acetobacter senegalensis]
MATFFVFGPPFLPAGHLSRQDFAAGARFENRFYCSCKSIALS